MIDPTGHWPDGKFLPKYIRDFVELKPKPVYNLPSLEEIRSRALAPLERIQQRNSGGSGGGIYPQPPKTQAQLYFEKVKAEFFKKFCEDGSKQVKKDEGIDWKRVEKGFFGVVKVVNGFLEATISSVAVVGTAGLAYAGMAFGCNQMSEGIGDIVSAFTNPKKKSFNPIRDTVFMGNETAYDLVETIVDFANAANVAKTGINAIKGTSKIASSEATKLMQNTARANLPDLPLISGRGNVQVETRTVGRWMSDVEYEKMVKTGKVQMSPNGNRTYVSNPASSKAYPSAPKGSVYVEFDVDVDSIIQAGKEGWSQIPGPGSLIDRLNRKKGLDSILEMPDALNIRKLGGK